MLQQQRSLQHHPWAPDVAAASAGVQQAEAALSAAQQKVAYSALTAPFSGTVIARLHNEGETVDQPLPVVQITGNDNPVLTAQFSPGDVQHIHVGDVATLQAQGLKGTAQGHVVAISSSQSTDAHTIPVIIGLNAANVEFGPGAYGSATIRVGSQKGLVVPSSAIVKDPTTGSTQVFRKQGGGYAPVPVSIRSETDTIALVETPDLHVGDAIVSRGAYELAVPGAAQAKTDPDTH
ncbi:MAG: HlyD family efflux transporter periplasmic adaptor subunit [Candidatus Eremiobacteraeota bacterium]|nr:HlyD family efflux transporter periplasmic adaptor subunit [Candidatus Eremiobacteraeota bacterium]MBC5826588.1 HlyD family efflux transporter periplasmic adaptor subunit [Candidatus Eremiobacteraeota bacterium]